MHSLVGVDGWQTGATDITSRLTLSAYRLSADFQRWVRDANRGGRNLTEANNLKAEQFGTCKKPKFQLKGGETNSFLEYMLSFLPDRVAALGEDGACVLQAGKHLFEILQIIRQYAKHPPASAIQAMHSNAKSYLRIMGTLRVKPKPKDHMLIELASRMAFLGSPQLYGCWHDEALNKLLKEVAGGAHPMVHERRILIQFPIAHDNDRAGRTTAKRRRTE